MSNFYDFYRDDIISGYICELLRTTNIPLVDTVQNSLNKNYKGFFIERGNVVENIVNNNKIERILKFPYTSGKPYKGLTFNYNSPNTVYTSTLHYFLGRYLRYIRDIYDLNLMHLYNCFSNEFISDVTLNDSNYEVSSNNSYRVVMVPIRLDQVYTIAIECPEDYKILPLIYGPQGILDLKVNNNYPFKTLHKASNFSSPYLYSLDQSLIEGMTVANERELKSQIYNNQRYLKLVIQLPRDNTSSITILEGDYVNIPSKSVFSLKTEQDSAPLLGISTSDINKVLLTTPELLSVNDNKYHAFNIKLIEYISKNAITHCDNIENDILRIQEAASDGEGIRWSGFSRTRLSPEFYTKDVWNNNLRYYIYSNSIGSDLIANKHDIDGFITKDVEILTVEER